MLPRFPPVRYRQVIVPDATPQARGSLLQPERTCVWASALLGAALFAVTLGGTYVYDDIDVFVMDARLRDPGSWHLYWTESYNAGVDNLYRPLVSMTYCIQWWLHGAAPQLEEADAWKYHLVNILLHAAVSGLVAELARRLAGVRVAWGAGLIFASHPIHVEAVANIIGRAELMCALGVVGAMVLFSRPLTIARSLAITGCVVLAIGSKEQGMLTPLLLLVMGLTRRLESRPVVPEGSDPRARTLLVLLLAWLLAGYIFFREWILKFEWDRNFLDWTINPLIHPDADRWTLPLVLLGRYTALLVAPTRLSPDYGAAVMPLGVSVTDPYLWVGVAAILGWVTWLILSLRRRNSVAVICLIGLALTYGVVSNFPLLIGTNFGERLMYLPSVFFCILVGLLIARLPRASMPLVLAVIVALFSVRTFTYALRWNDRLSFYQISLREQPRSVRLHLLLSSELLSRGDFDAAAEVAQSATRLLPDYWEGWIMRANVAMNHGEFDAAEEYLLTASRTPRSPTGRIASWMVGLEERRASTRPAEPEADDVTP